MIRYIAQRTRENGLFKAFARLTGSARMSESTGEIIGNGDTQPEQSEDHQYEKVTEGQATILFPKESNEVFYNPIQQFNRDLSTVAIRAWAQGYKKQIIEKKKRNINKKKRKLGSDEAENDAENTHSEPDIQIGPYINILEALSATGLRAVRYGKEIPDVKKVLANDFSASAVENIRRNVEYNNVGDIVEPHEGDANAVMYQHLANQFHVIDLDPYGTAAPFIDAAVRSVATDGLLCITCTDLAVLAGNGYPEKCFALYGGNPLWGRSTHEAALRLVLHCIATSAARYKRTIEPLLSLSIDFYVRVFVRIKTSPLMVKDLASKTMISYHCSGCQSISNQHLGKSVTNEKGNKKHSIARGPPVSSNCDHCGSVQHLAGPMWAGPLHNKEFISDMLAIHETLDPKVYGTLDRIKGMLSVAQQEIDAPFYFEPGRLASIIKCMNPPMEPLTAALTHAGYQVSLTHAQRGCLKTDAPYDFIWKVYREYIKTTPQSNSSKQQEGSVAYKLRHGKESENGDEPAINFEPNDASKQLQQFRKIKIVRFQENPTENWGPKARATNKKLKKASEE